MRVARLVPVFLFSFLIAKAVLPQQLSTPVPQPDPTAVSLIQQSLKVMGAANAVAIQDTETVAQATFFSGKAESTSTVTFKTLGTHFLRAEGASAAGSSVFAINDKEASSKVGTEDSQFIPLPSVGNAGVTHIPIFSVLADWNVPGTLVEYIDLEKLDTAVVQHIRLTPPLSPELPPELASPCDIYIDQTSLLVLKLVYLVRPPSDLKQQVSMEVTYADYQLLYGIAVPQTVTRTINGQIIEQYKVSSFSINHGIQKSAFDAGAQS